MFSMSRISLLVFADIICVVLSFSVYILDEEATPSDAEAAKRDLSEADIEEAHHLEPAEAQPERFRYESSQIESLDRPAERCYDDLNRCLLSSISNPRPVCAYNDLIVNQKLQSKCAYPKIAYYGDKLKQCTTRTFRSYCDAYFDNCKRGYRYWRILDTGRCEYEQKKTHGGHSWGSDLFTVVNT